MRKTTQANFYTPKELDSLEAKYFFNGFDWLEKHLIALHKAGHKQAVIHFYSNVEYEDTALMLQSKGYEIEGLTKSCIVKW